MEFRLTLPPVRICALTSWEGGLEGIPLIRVYPHKNTPLVSKSAETRGGGGILIRAKNLKNFAAPTVREKLLYCYNDVIITLFDSRAQREKILGTSSSVLHLKTPFLKGFLSKILKNFRCAARVTPYAKKLRNEEAPLVSKSGQTGAFLLGKNLEILTSKLMIL